MDLIIRRDARVSYEPFRRWRWIGSLSFRHGFLRSLFLNILYSKGMREKTMSCKRVLWSTYSPARLEVDRWTSHGPWMQRNARWRAPMAKVSGNKCFWRRGGRGAWLEWSRGRGEQPKSILGCAPKSERSVQRTSPSFAEQWKTGRFRSFRMSEIADYDPGSLTSIRATYLWLKCRPRII